MRNLLSSYSLTFLVLLFIGLQPACKDPIQGCTDTSAANFDPEAGIEDGSCEYASPDRYEFVRSSSSTLDYSQEVMRMLLINDLDIVIASLAESGASPVTQDQLLQYYAYEGSYDLSILTPVGNSFKASDSAFNSIASDTRLSDVAVDLPPVAQISQDILDWTATIADRSTGSSLGNPAVYTTDQGLDLREMIRVNLLAAVIYGNAPDSMLVWVDTLDNISFNSSCNCTDMENDLDRSFGYWGGARNFRAFSSEELAGEEDSNGDFPYVKDDNGDGIIDYQSEYNYEFARITGKRDLGSEGKSSFGSDLFDAFLEARAAATIGPGQESRIRAEADQALIIWDELVAATSIHYINNVLASMARIGSAEYDEARHNRYWADMFAFTQMIAFYSQNQVGTPVQIYDNFLLPMGDAPVYDLPGSTAHTQYVNTLTGLRDLLGQLYAFPQDLVDSW